MQKRFFHQLVFSVCFESQSIHHFLGSMEASTSSMINAVAGVHQTFVCWTSHPVLILNHNFIQSESIKPSKYRNKYIDVFWPVCSLVSSLQQENMMIIGYARVSTQEQNLQMQLDALKEHGCEKVYSEKASGGNTSRPELDKMLELLRRGDTVVIWKLDRLGRSLKHLIDLVSAFDSQGVGLVSLKENIDTTTATGKLVFNIFAALAEFERDIIRERTFAGLVSARARGKTGGRKKSLGDAQIKMLTQMASDKTRSVADICKQRRISKAS